MPAAPRMWPGKPSTPLAAAMAAWSLGWVAYCTDDYGTMLTWMRQACRVDPASIPGWLARLCAWLLAAALSLAGEAAAAQRGCAAVLAQALGVGDLRFQANMLWTLADWGPAVRPPGRRPRTG